MTLVAAGRSTPNHHRIPEVSGYDTFELDLQQERALVSTSRAEGEGCNQRSGEASTRDSISQTAGSSDEEPEPDAIGRVERCALVKELPHSGEEVGELIVPAPAGTISASG